MKKKIKDPAVGRTREERAFGEGVRTGSSRAKEFYGTRSIQGGIYGGVRPSFGRYQVSEQATDMLGR